MISPVSLTAPYEDFAEVLSRSAEHYVESLFNARDTALARRVELLRKVLIRVEDRLTKLGEQNA